MSPKVLVAGIGNIFLGDDAFGCEVLARLAQSEQPEGVTIRDFGIRSLDLAYALMSEWDRVILVDALSRGGKPGTLYLFEPELPESDERPPALDAHTMDPVAVLHLVRSLGGTLKPLLVVGCEPVTLEPDADGHIGLSPPVASAVEEAARMIEGLIARARSEKIAA
jgi:hydrogenase maturation protease